ncbi:MAG: hypothetical protein ACI82I_003428 [Gammaproteobacteria bacterium]|jgi:hypothetical protein
MTTNAASFPRSVVMHIGAHKTATTHLQRSLLAQQQALTSAGIQYYGPANLRRPGKGPGDIFGLDIYHEPSKPTRSRAEQADFMFKDGHRLILSDENFIGALHDKQGNIISPLYPKAAKRIAALAGAVGAGPMDVCIGLRNPASFLKSAYSQALIGGKPIAFSDYLSKNPLDQIYWPGLVGRVRSAAGVGRVTVWAYEDYKWRFHKICGALMGDLVNMRILPISDYVHRGLSEAAVARVLSKSGADDPRSMADEARSTYPVSDEYPAFDPFSPTEKAASEAEYAAQLAAIGKIDGVTILGP